MLTLTVVALLGRLKASGMAILKIFKKYSYRFERTKWQKKILRKKKTEEPTARRLEKRGRRSGASIWLRQLLLNYLVIATLWQVDFGWARDLGTYCPGINFES